MGTVPGPAAPEPGRPPPTSADRADPAIARLAALATPDSWRPPPARDLLRLVGRVPIAARVLVAVLVLGMCGGLAALHLSGGAGAAGSADKLVPRAVRVPSPADAGAASSTSTPEDLVVHVAGAVAVPGVRRLPAGARVGDAVTAAGGPSPGAELGRVNLAAPLVDGTQVYVPAIGETVPSVLRPGGAGPLPATAGDQAELPVDLNSAAEAELEELPGVGPAIAAAIVRYRAERRFTAVDDLLAVPGIGPAKLEALREHVRV